MEESRKKKLAIWMNGGIGGGLFGQGFPLIVQIVERLAMHYDVTVYSATSIPRDFEARGYKVYSPPARAKRLSMRWTYLILCFLKHRLKTRYDILYSFWGYPAGTVIVALGKVLNIPSFVNILGAETANVPEIQYGYLRKKTLKTILWTFKNATEVIAVSKYQVKKLKENGFHRTINVIPWGVDSHQFYSVPRKRELPLKILHVANLNEVKDQETLLKAFKVVRSQIPSKLRIVGDDYLNGKIHRLAIEMGLEQDVEFTGAIPHTQIAAQYHWADTFMLTSLSEGQNNSITEAMMCGVLPVSTAVGIMYDLGEEVGVITEPYDYKGLANSLVALYHNEAEWQKRNAAALYWATHHDLDWTIVALRDLIRKLSDSNK